MKSSKLQKWWRYGFWLFLIFSLPWLYVLFASPFNQHSFFDALRSIGNVPMMIMLLSGHGTILIPGLLLFFGWMLAGIISLLCFVYIFIEKLNSRVTIGIPIFQVVLVIVIIGLVSLGFLLGYRVTQAQQNRELQEYISNLNTNHTETALYVELRKDIDLRSFIEWVRSQPEEKDSGGEGNSLTIRVSKLDARNFIDRIKGHPSVERIRYNCTHYSWVEKYSGKRYFISENGILEEHGSFGVYSNTPCKPPYY